MLPGICQRDRLKVLPERPTTVAVHNHTGRLRRTKILRPGSSPPPSSNRTQIFEHRRLAAGRATQLL